MRLLPILAVPAALLALVLAFMIVLFGGIDTAAASDFDHQCAVAIPNPSSTSRTAPSRGARTAPVSPPVTSNPYAELTFAADDTSVSDRQRTCASAMRTAIYQGPPVNEPATGAGARCAGETIAALVNRGERGGAVVEPAAVTAAVLHRASAAVSTGYCPPLSDAEADTLSVARSGGNADRCPLPGGSAVLDLPDNAAAQSLCGQLVAVGAESPGDLVFWDYRGSVPTRVGMVADGRLSTDARLSTGAVLMVSWDTHSGRLVQLALPSGWDVRVKRMLGDAA
ncbi:C40 family peptidase [Nocardia sp. NBC_01503]|uniref:hypothetical protein n=1 Tax=Nocardia sp. NBC_01503 TaxID=2975997 RepID=UPI002E7B95F4|nr:hypothetical protein [Nocardia sp. NBC_01503]WTL29886.1 C40 family peptidase [Nocardia sp. NBC_01503]